MGVAPYMLAESDLRCEEQEQVVRVNHSVRLERGLRDGQRA